PPQVQSTNYASTSSTNTSQNQEPRHCHYCGRTEHLIAKCRTRQAEQKSRDDRREIIIGEMITEEMNVEDLVFVAVIALIFMR
ncbi:22395_t:CDS:1, partial [Dentiscutata erythropus]